MTQDSDHLGPGCSRKRQAICSDNLEVRWDDMDEISLSHALNPVDYTDPRIRRQVTKHVQWQNGMLRDR